ncbi:DUF3822 family protein [Nonlabens tegetincola]|uniref:DUF3822 family protein n=1 Tax=Nonlabens tegetincola TaxID=323273 RepID=UPI000A0026A6|nr:DUF3822 family protein [Nonlabens tegetincola]
MKLQQVVTGLESMQIINKSENILNELSVLIHQNGLSFFTHIGNRVENSYHKSFKYSNNPIELLQEIESIYNKEEFVNKSFSKVNIYYHHPIFTCVPNAYFDPSNSADYLKYTTQLLETDVISHDNLKELTTVYIAYSNLNNFFFEKHGDLNYYHLSTQILKKEENIERQNHAYLNLLPNHFYLSVYKDDKLVAHNSYPYESKEDLLYYTVFSLQQFNCDVETTVVTVKGEKIDEELFDVLYKYIRHVEKNENINYLKELICA